LPDVPVSEPAAGSPANLDADPQAEIVVDMGALGVWVFNGGVWSQLSATNPDSLIARKT
jgi:hypothetical protein